MMNILFPYQSKSPLCGVAQTPGCGISFKAFYVVSLRRPTVAFLLKPFLWCRSDARLWYYYFAFSARGVFQTLVWHQYLLFCIFRSRSLSDTRLAPVFI